MSDEDDSLKLLRKRIEQGEPIAQLVLQLPIKISIGPRGMVRIDSLFGVAGLEQACFQRTILPVSPAMLKAALKVLENKPHETFEIKALPSA